MARVAVQEEDFSLGDEAAALLAACPGAGGLGAFVGVVRSLPGEPVAALVLEHYPAMTLPALNRIATEAEARFDLLGCTVIHRHGRLSPGEQIVLVLAASAHRQPALDATAFLIDWLKTKAPFWKKEEHLDGSTAWVEARAEDDLAASRW